MEEFQNLFKNRYWSIQFHTLRTYSYALTSCALLEMQRVQYIPSPGYPVCYPPHSTSLPYPTQPLMYPVPPTQNYPSAAASLPYPPYEEHETIPLQKIWSIMIYGINTSCWIVQGHKKYCLNIYVLFNVQRYNNITIIRYKTVKNYHWLMVLALRWWNTRLIV